MMNAEKINENAQELDKAKTETQKSSIKSWIIYIVVLLGVVLVFRYVLAITVIVGNSMNPTLENKYITLTGNLGFTPERNDIILFRDANGFDVIKRVIALPNETVEIKNGMVFINGNPVEENYITGMSNDMPQTVVKEDSYFVMGDNREPGESLDSRSSEVGPIHKDRIKGKLLISIFPFGKVE